MLNLSGWGIVIGMKNESAVRLGRVGGLRRSEAKARACRENGKLGGNPALKPKRMTALEALAEVRPDVAEAMRRRKVDEEIELERNRVEMERRMRAYR